MNHTSEYWYIGSIFAKSAEKKPYSNLLSGKPREIIPIEKKSIVLCTAMGVYSSLVLSISTSVTSAIACFAAISFDSTFDELKICTAVSSSRMLPSEVLSTSRILSSISFRILNETKIEMILIVNRNKLMIPFVFGTLDDKLVFFSFEVWTFFGDRYS